MQLNDLDLAPGIAFHLQGVKVRKTKGKGFSCFNIACRRRKYFEPPKEGWFILINLSSLLAAIRAYKKRFCIEEMFRYF